MPKRGKIQQGFDEFALAHMRFCERADCAACKAVLLLTRKAFFEGAAALHGALADAASSGAPPNKMKETVVSLDEELEAFRAERELAERGDDENIH